MRLAALSSRGRAGYRSRAQPATRSSAKRPTPRTILTGLIRDLGGDPDYVSPTARVAQAKSEALLASALVSGPLSTEELEASDLENVLLAETKDHADWELLGQLAEQLPNGKARTAIEAAVAEVEPQGRALEWDKTKLAASRLRASWTSPTHPERLDRCVIQPELKISRSTRLDGQAQSRRGAKLPASAADTNSRTSTAKVR